MAALRVPGSALAVLCLATLALLAPPEAAAARQGFCFSLDADIDARPVVPEPIPLRWNRDRACPIDLDLGDVALAASLQDGIAEGTLRIRSPVPARIGDLGGPEAAPPGRGLPGEGGVAQGEPAPEEDDAIFLTFAVAAGSGCSGARGVVHVVEPVEHRSTFGPEAAAALCRGALAVLGAPAPAILAEGAVAWTAALLGQAAEEVPALLPVVMLLRQASPALPAPAPVSVPQTDGAADRVLASAEGQLLAYARPDDAAAGAEAGVQGEALDQPTRVGAHLEFGPAEPSLADAAAPAPPQPPSPAASAVASAVRGEPRGAQPPGGPPPSLDLAPRAGPKGPADAPILLPQAASAPQAAGSPMDLGALAPSAGLAGLAGLAAWLYHRLARPAVLEHPKRAALHAACLARNAPATVGELAAAAALPAKTAEYHLVYLVKRGYLREERAAGGPRRFLPPTLRPCEPGEPLDVRVLAVVGARPGLTAPELAAVLRVSTARAARAAKDLLLDGAIESRVEANVRRLYPAAAP